MTTGWTQIADAELGSAIEAARTAYSSGDNFDAANEAFLHAYTLSTEAQPRSLEHATLVDEYAGFLAENDEYVRARRLWEEALDLRRELGAPPSAAGATLNQLATLERDHGNYSAGLEYQLEAIREFEREYEAGSEVLRDVQLSLLTLYFTLDDRESAKTLSEQILAEARATYGLSEQLANVHDMVGNHHYNASWDERLIEIRMEALSIRRSIRGRNSLGHALALRDTADEFVTDHWSEEATGLQKAAELYREALAVYAAAGYADAAEIADTHSDLAGVLSRLSDTEASEDEYQQAISLRTNARLDTARQAQDLCLLADLLYEDARAAEAAVEYQRCLDIRRNVFEETHTLVGDAIDGLQSAYAESGRVEEAINLLRERVAFHEEYGEGYTVLVAALTDQIGDYYSRLDRHEEAVAAYERVVGIEEQEYGADNEALIASLSKLQAAYDAAGETQKRDAVRTRIAAITLDTTVGDTLGVFGEDIPGTEIPWYIAILFSFSLGGLGLVIGGIVFSLRLVDKADEKEALAGLAPVAGANAFAPVKTGAESSPSQTSSTPAVTPSVPSPTPVAVPLSSYRLQFHGEGRAFFGIWIVNVLLTLITLGIYYFWGKVRIRRYIWANSELDGDRFAFHGTPLELFIGWLKASPLIAFMLWGPNIVLLLTSDVTYSTYTQLAGVGLFLLFWPIAEVGSYRYRLTRSSYRGLRFSFHGKTWRYLTLYLLNWPVWLFTAGLWTPFFNALKRRFLINHTRFGDSPMACTASGSDLLGPYVLNWFLLLPTLGIYRFWYLAKREQYYWSRTTYRGVRFRCTIKGSDLFTMTVLGGLATILSLGFASAWVECWKNRIWLDSISMQGEFDPEWIHQNLQSGDATGDSMADFLGVDLGFFSS